MLDYIKKNWLGLLGFIILIEAIGAISGFFSQGSAEIYSSLVKPPLSPPSLLFGIVWPILYALLGISLYRIYKSKNTDKGKQALLIFFIQLAVNVIWPLAFFTFESYIIALVVLLILDALAIIMYQKFLDIDKLSAQLLIPYLIWIIFATYLNIGIVILN